MVSGRAVEGSRYFESPLLYKENGFKEREDSRRTDPDILSEEPPDRHGSDIVDREEKGK